MNHIPVLKNEIIDQFDYLKEGDIFVDGTLGAGGHSIELARKYKIQIIGIDRDENALKLAKENVEKEDLSQYFTFVHNNFKEIKDILDDLQIREIKGALLDLGVSSMQLDRKERGFSFSDPEAPIDMRMDQTQLQDGKYIVNNYDEDRLAKIIYNFGGEKFGRQIAREIIKSRPVDNMGGLIDAIQKAIPYKSQYSTGKHFATRTLQAIRIEVNRELDGLENAIDDYISLLYPDGRLTIITFHSLEDKIVKNKFKELSQNCVCPPKAPMCVCNHKATVEIVNRGPVEPSAEEIESNRRSRSSKLRTVEKLCD